MMKNVKICCQQSQRLIKINQANNTVIQLKFQKKMKNKQKWDEKSISVGTHILNTLPSIDGQSDAN